MVSASVQKLQILANFVIGEEAGFALSGAENNHNVRMNAPANQLPDFHYNVTDSRQKLNVSEGLCGKRVIYWVLSPLTKTLMVKGPLRTLFHGLLAVCARQSQI